MLDLKKNRKFISEILTILLAVIAVRLLCQSHRLTTFALTKGKHSKNQLLTNSNWTEWSTIQLAIAQVLSKSDEHDEARGRFEITSTITP